MVDFTRANELTPEAEKEIEFCFGYQPWDAKQVEAGRIIREALATAVKWMVQVVPPCPDRTSAIRKLREARMDCNSAITFKGKY